MNNKPNSSQFAQLGRVMSMRVRKAHTAYLEQLELWRDAKRKVEEQTEEVKGLNRDLQQVLIYMEQDATALDPVKLQFGVSRRRWVIYDKEKAEYYLDVAKQDLQEAADEMLRLKNIWLRVIAREEKITENRVLAQEEEFLDAEMREEVELEDTQQRGDL